MNERLIQVDGIEIRTDSFGRIDDPVVLLIMGAQSSLIWWEEEFCHRLAQTGRFVIRYDNRDVGVSTTYEPGQPDYTFEDMADDAIRVLNAYKIERAHIVGMSMGGMLAQMIALRRPERVLTVTLLSTSNFAPELPPMEERIMNFFSNLGEIDWTNEQSVVDFAVDRSKILAGSKHSFNENKVRALAKMEFARSSSMASIHNHALLAGGESYLTRTSEIKIPALVIHGTEDPIIPYKHGQNLANVLPGAVLLTLEGTGHELHEDDWDTVIESIARHTSKPDSFS
ncbi:alpha/beta fold hydrolase [Paenibacillus sp. OAS669]|uniref:alpha/beta fold hydrolase n=1 Tax=Paenibacillus sp. OAS669 TaxID=2663821 RepID=UPI00178B2078|nr:alpha/beta hydrolase [Paenibacillus sp. OAS669]MBE1440844.1 pimeloyl-ACP methyl ester carboxylesterase [Paenibacillus sp. OAS669]